jgi:hypothetical protein
VSSLRRTCPRTQGRHHDEKGAAELVDGQHHAAALADAVASIAFQSFAFICMHILLYAFLISLSLLLFFSLCPSLSIALSLFFPLSHPSRFLPCSCLPPFFSPFSTLSLSLSLFLSVEAFCVHYVVAAIAAARPDLSHTPSLVCCGRFDSNPLESSS